MSVPVRLLGALWFQAISSFRLIAAETDDISHDRVQTGYVLTPGEPVRFACLLALSVLGARRRSHE